jgi:hypothetical protein
MGNGHMWSELPTVDYKMDVLTTDLQGQYRLAEFSGFQFNGLSSDFTVMF